MLPVLEYGISVWDPQDVVLQGEIESMQKRATSFGTGNNNYEPRSVIRIFVVKMGIPQEKEQIQ